MALEEKMSENVDDDRWTMEAYTTVNLFNFGSYLFFATSAKTSCCKNLIQCTGHSRYVDFAYLDTTTNVEVIFHSQNIFFIFLCISTPSMSKTVNMKQRVSRGDLTCPRRIFYYVCYCLCQS